MFQQNPRADKAREAYMKYESDFLELLIAVEQYHTILKRDKAAYAAKYCRDRGLDGNVLSQLLELRVYLLGVMADHGIVPRAAASRAQRLGPGSTTGALLPPCLHRVYPSDEYHRRRYRMVRAVLVAALWPNVGMLSDQGDTMFAKRQRAIHFHRGSCVGKAVEALAGKDGWNCPNPNCGFFNFNHRDYCCKCEKETPTAPPKKDELRHKLFMFSAKELQQLNEGQTKVVV